MHSKLQSERREFRVDPALLMSVIDSQAGTPQKALLEGIMNAVDSGATRCDISLNEKGYTVRDNGCGFKSRQEIESFFETFGTPHKADDGAVFGTYRMGRGQLFSFSSTRWITGSFIMEVDIKGRGLEYDLHVDAPHEQGCTIIGTWYEPMHSADVIKIDFELRKLAMWVQIPVYINNKLISKDAAKEVWTYETEDAFILLKPNTGLSVYNLGALVSVYSERYYGTGGTIVSKKQLKVNFARNDILISKCDVWKRIRTKLEADLGTVTLKKKQLNHSEKHALAERFSKGQIQYVEISSTKILTDVSGKSRSLNELRNYKNLCVVHDVKEWTVGERVMEQGIAFVLRSEAVSQFGVDTAKEFLELLTTRIQPTLTQQNDYQKWKTAVIELDAQKHRLTIPEEVDRCSIYEKRHPRHAEYKELSHQRDEAVLERDAAYVPLRIQKYFDHVKAVTLEEVSGHITDQYNYFESKKLPPHQKAMRKGLQEVITCLHQHDADDALKRLSHDEKQALNINSPYEYMYTNGLKERDIREVLVGKSDVAQAWTDGETFVAIDQDVIRDVLAGKQSLGFLISVMVHEFSHVEPDQGGHIHSMEFYKRFHDLMILPHLAERLRYILVTAYSKAIDELGKKPNQVFLAEIRRINKKMKHSLADMTVYAAGGPIILDLGEEAE